jgi:hypothetical protein
MISSVRSATEAADDAVAEIREIAVRARSPTDAGGLVANESKLPALEAASGPLGISGAARAARHAAGAVAAAAGVFAADRGRWHAG